MTTDEAHETVRGWFTGRLPQEWFTGPVEVTVDREEIVLLGPLAAPETGEGASDAERAAAADGRINPLYDSGDGVHPNDAGHALIFSRVKSVLDSANCVRATAP